SPRDRDLAVPELNRGRRRAAGARADVRRAAAAAGEAAPAAAVPAAATAAAPGAVEPATAAEAEAACLVRIVGLIPAVRAACDLGTAAPALVGPVLVGRVDAAEAGAAPLPERAP